MKILIVDDNSFDADLINRYLKENINDCTIDVVHTYSEAEKVAGHNYDIALLDYQLPDGFGIDLIPLLISFNKQILIIILTGMGNEETAVAALQAGADDYIVKKEGYLSKLVNKINFQQGKTPEEKGRILKPIRVLYVEHNKADVDITIIHFKQFAPNFHFTAVENGEEAIKELTGNDLKEPFDIVLMDYRLPGFDALEVTNEIRQEHNLDIPIVIVTGQGSEETAIQALKLGANDYVVKQDNYLYRLSTILNHSIQQAELKRQSKALRQSEEMFRSIFEDHSAIKYIIDPENGKIVAANNAASEYYGWSVEELKKMTIFEINTLPKAELIQLIEKAKTEAKTQFEFKHKHADGSISDVLVFSGKVNIAGKEHLHSVVYDISKRKMAEKQLRLLNASIEQSPISTIITDNQGAIEYVNPFFTKTTGYSFDEVLGKNPRLLKSGTHDQAFYKNLWDTINSGKNWMGEMCNKKKNGELYWEQEIISPIKDAENNITHFVGIKEDVTEKRKLIQELITAKDKAEESDRLKSAFLANMSHEIRTPMNGILGFTNLLLEPQLSDDDKEEFIKIIHQSSERMLNTVNDIVEISKIEAGMVNVSYSTVNIQNMLEFEKSFFQPQAKKKNLQMQFENHLSEQEFIVRTDRNKLESILNNLINNAIKYTDAGSIKVTCIKSDEFIEFCVEDTGIGIPTNRQAAVFNRFEQADIEDTRAFQGSGLGLAISKSYVEILGGKIWLESVEGRGSKFYFTLPVVQENNQLEKLPDIKESVGKNLSNRNLKVLIAEDDDISVMYLTKVLTGVFQKITFTGTGEETIEEIKKNPDYDIILMDIKMPGLNGYEATKQIRMFNKNVIIIAQTAYAMPGDYKAAVSAGCDDYISKPINQKALLEKINLQLMKKGTGEGK